VLRYAPKHAEALMPKLLLTVDESRHDLGGKGRAYIYGLIADGQIDSVKLGRSRMIVADSLRRFVESLEINPERI
jgi:hypothetical protein